ncbi:MAG: Uncharcterized protein family, partial [Phenylobacterium sp.]|uniref:DUF927 domain-containing protein n=1 Tax=Phenylobacterium sp. TaxID=1871053 RepID=UPI00260F24C4
MSLHDDLTSVNESLILRPKREPWPSSDSPVWLTTDKSRFARAILPSMVSVNYINPASDILEWTGQTDEYFKIPGDDELICPLNDDGQILFFHTIRPPSGKHHDDPEIEGFCEPTAILRHKTGARILVWTLTEAVPISEMALSIGNRIGWIFDDGGSTVPLPGDDHWQLVSCASERRYTLAQLKDALDKAPVVATPISLPEPVFGKLAWVDFRGRKFFGSVDDKGVGTPLVAPFAVVGAARYPDRENLRDVAVGFDNEVGEREVVRIPADDIPARDKVIGLLRGRGLIFAHAKDGAALVHQLLMGTQPPPTTVYDRPGWVPGGGFLMPSGVVVGADPARVGLSDRVRINAPATAGTFEGWRAGAEVAWTSESLSLKAALAAGFAGPLLALAGRGTLVLALTGTTSQGKTWRQKVSVAVSGPPKEGVGQMRSLNSTENALEAPLARGSATITAFDETHFTDPATVQRLVFLAAGGLGKARLARD